MTALTISAHLNTAYIPVTSQPRLVYLLLEVGAPGATRQNAQPVNLALAVDCSYSMYIRMASDQELETLRQAGLVQQTVIDGMSAWRADDIPSEIMARLPRQLDFVLEALKGIVDQLHPGDRVALIAFAGSAVTVLPGTAAANRERLLDAISSLENLQLGDDTYMGRGLELAYDECMAGALPTTVNRILLLTDGYTLDEQLCRAWAERAQARVAVSTLGLGGAFNEELLIPIAETTGGHAHYIDDPAAMPALFEQELRSAQAIAQRELEIKLLLTGGVELRAAYRVRPAIGKLSDLTSQGGGSFSLPLGDLEPDSPPAVLLELIAPPRPAGRYRLAKTVLTYLDPNAGLSRQQSRLDVVAEYTPNPALAVQSDARVMQLLQAVNAYKLQVGAAQDLASGDVRQATRKLQAAATRLLDMGEDELAAAMQEQAAALETQGQTDERATKKLRYATRKLTGLN